MQIIHRGTRSFIAKTIVVLSGGLILGGCGNSSGTDEPLVKAPPAAESPTPLPGAPKGSKGPASAADIPTSRR